MAAPQDSSILVCTLGTSWAVVPEVLGFLAPEQLDLYRDHPEAAALAGERQALATRPLAEIRIVATGGPQVQAAIDSLRQWWTALAPPVRLRIFVAADAVDLVQEKDIRAVRELILRLCLHTTAEVGWQRTILSLAGGRKTMSADLQRAGHFFGCAALLHLIASEPLPDELKTAGPEMFARPLPRALAEHLRPVVLGHAPRSELADIDVPEYPALRPQDYPIAPGDLPSTAPGFTVHEWSCSGSFLIDKIEQRERRASHLQVEQLAVLLKEEPRPNWIGLYRLPHRQLQELRRTDLADKHRDWLRRLPKADLHVHLGGVLDVTAQREVARALNDALTEEQRSAALAAVQPLLSGADWPGDWPDVLRRGDGQAPCSAAERSARAAAILLALSVEDLERRLFGPTEPRRALRDRHPLGFHAYERPGELSGSALLGHEGAVAEYARQVYRRLRCDGLRYAELRGSPSKYLGGDGQRFLTVFADAVRAAQRDESGTQVVFVVCVDRRLEDQVEDAVRTAVEVRRAQDLRGFVVGLDVAGDERVMDDAGFRNLACLLEPAFADCLPITIHAGEGEGADNIWSAVYRLHAERVGHALTLGQRPDLARRLRDRGIALELCPTSNLEVVGFHEPGDPSTAARDGYPLGRYLKEFNLPIAVCTDNPGISRTDLGSELRQAARLSGGLTLWETLAIVRNGFVHAFLGASERERLLREADEEVVRLVNDL